MLSEAKHSRSRRTPISSAHPAAPKGPSTTNEPSNQEIMSTITMHPGPITTTPEVPTFKVLGIRVDAVQIPDAIGILEQWIAQRQGSRYVAVTGMHGVSESLTDKPFRAMLDAASLVVSDGMPLVWLGRWHGHRHMARRVYGPELMKTFGRETGTRYRHYFYGGAEGVPEHLAHSMH